MKNLFIVESPGKLKTISKYLGDDWIVVASVGHIRDLPEKEIGIDNTNYKPTYVLTESGKKAVKNIKDKAKYCNDVYLATDLDREGEAIAWHLKEVLSLKDPKRVDFNEITESAINHAVNNPRNINMRLVAAQECRRVIDRIIGYLVSPAICEILKAKRLSAGRVQTPALIILNDREQEIASFKPKEHYSVDVIFEGWKAELDIKSVLGKSAEYLFSKEVAQKIASNNDYKIKIAESKPRKQLPSPPFETVTLQKAASAQLNLSPTETMAVAQKLYEKGLITYMRTDSTLISDTAFELLKLHLYETKLPFETKKRVWKNSDSSQEAHECIRPSNFNTTSPEGLNDNEEKLYTLIWNRTAASQMPPAEYNVYRIALEGREINGQKPIFTAKTDSLEKKGWRILGNVDKEDIDEELDKEVKLPKLTPGSMLTGQASVVDKKTRAPKRYTQPALIAELKKRGIGRPSTYASILDNIIHRKYVGFTDKKNSYFQVTKIGQTVATITKTNFSFCRLDFTAEIEKSLDSITQGKLSYKNVVSPIYENVTNEIKLIGK
jgi:DNA topoisomerase-1